ncbi:hypothetical protein EUTSA_v10003069mg [Eutrema salsugineum]|uniref:Uncharacterized protein n=1 Tax=Eutrema salsugineum TaxID=72664 RepID=V4MWY3_EUTSA|nr:hypothetical protein EUTSA_v10003069mg [Eutrema salsugineum]
MSNVASKIKAQKLSSTWHRTISSQSYSKRSKLKPLRNPFQITHTANTERWESTVKITGPVSPNRNRKRNRVKIRIRFMNS